MKQIILASASPRRKELLEQMGLSFCICPAKGEELQTKTKPSEVVMELAMQKADEIAAQFLESKNYLILGADTIVACENQILGKPKKKEDAQKMLSLLSGKCHTVYTGAAFVFDNENGMVQRHVFYEKTNVWVKTLSKSEIDRYIASGEPMDKAGAYGIQGKGAVFIERIEGDYNNVVGLPIARIYKELQMLGIDCGI